MNEDDRNGLPGGAERDPGLDRVYRAAGRDEPPARLDAAILAAAHREVGARPRAATSVLRRWQVPVSIAAVIVLSVSLVTLVQEEGGEQLVRPAPPARPSMPPASEMARTAPAPAEAGRPRPSFSEPAKPVVEPRRHVPAGAPVATDGLAADSLGEAAGPSSEQQGAGEVAQPDGMSRPRPQPFRDAAPSSSERRAATPPAEDSAPAAAERNAAPMASAPAPAPARSRIMAEARKEAASADAGAPVWQGFDKEPPRKWLERIDELRRQGRAADADAMLVEYKRRFPGHSLPTGQAGSAAPGTGP